MPAEIAEKATNTREDVQPPGSRMASIMTLQDRS
jgi:hypothetical protein